MNQLLPWLLSPLVLTLLVLLWVGQLSLIAQISGWAQLAKVYRHRGQFEGFRTRLFFGELRGGPLLGLPSHYGFSTLGSNDQGLYLAVLPVFRPGHPPLFVPWQDVTARLDRGWLLTYAIFSFQQMPSIRLRVWHRTARQMVDEAGTTESKAIEPIDWRLQCDTPST